VLDEDDYELLEDNNINIHRRKVWNLLYICISIFSLVFEFSGLLLYFMYKLNSQFFF